MTNHKNSMVVGDGKYCEELEQLYMSMDTSLRPSEVETDATKISCIGKTFKTLDGVFKFYNKYAKFKGFGVRKSSSRLSNKDKSVIAKRESGSEGLWEVTKFVSAHNHELHSSATIQFVWLHKRLNTIQKRQDVDEERNVPFSQRDIQNFVSNERKKSLQSGDARAALQFCDDLKQKNSDFFYMIDVDNEGKLNKFFRVDTKLWIAYNHFGDVVSIDSTYKRNRYDMPFVIFVGCNNHQQSIVFGVGLLCNETIDSYIWIFNTFLNAMNKVPPRVIITDQDAAISNAVSEVFPMTKHHLCRWHIVSKVEQKMTSIIQKDRDFKKEFNVAYLFSEPIEEFERKWNIISKKHSNVWMDSIYALRHKWVPTFTREVFTAGMSTTQRSESLNGFFKTYVMSFDEEEETILCSCKKFESEGILCRHALKTYLANNIFDIPNRYILERWTRDLVERKDCKPLVNLRYDDLCSKALRVVEGALDEEKYEAACCVLNKYYEELLSMQRDNPNFTTKFEEKNSPIGDGNVGAPPKNKQITELTSFQITKVNGETLKYLWDKGVAKFFVEIINTLISVMEDKGIIDYAIPYMFH
ncbi:hypothetical protein H6P81_003052 [Aristolochia fimbriata]|uniref:Protein FAR1-RELATED SEQUENCE n=1 Tax=Aristolochia fimbriata TaxID=158543 RepID=A0AAV7FDA6_ARIFI|nr:hypothetical protein H6P81_003052 [Aristolochia fimbriata]